MCYLGRRLSTESHLGRRLSTESRKRWPSHPPTTHSRPSPAATAAEHRGDSSVGPATHPAAPGPSACAVMRVGKGIRVEEGVYQDAMPPLIGNRH